MSRWGLVVNPAFAGQRPRPLRAACHDRSPFLTVVHDCGFEMHAHETQVAHVPAGDEIAMTCKGCGEMMLFPPGWFAQAFAQMRADGWIDDAEPGLKATTPTATGSAGEGYS